MKRLSLLWLIIFFLTIIKSNFSRAAYSQENEDDIVAGLAAQQRQQQHKSSNKEIHGTEFDDLLDKLENEMTNAKQFSSSNNNNNQQSKSEFNNVKGDEDDDDYFSNNKQQQESKLQVQSKISLTHENTKEKEQQTTTNNREQDEEEEENDFYKETNSKTITTTSVQQQKSKQQMDDQIIKEKDDDYHLNEDDINNNDKNELLESQQKTNKKTVGDHDDFDSSDDDLLGTGSTKTTTSILEDDDIHDNEDDIDNDDIEDHLPMDGDDGEDSEEQNLPTFSHAPVNPNDALKLDFDQEIEQLTQRSIEAKLDLEKFKRELYLKVQHRVLNDFVSKSDHETGCLHRAFNSSVVDLSTRIVRGWLGRMLSKLTSKKCTSVLKLLHLNSKPDCESVLTKIKTKNREITWDVWNGEKDTIDTDSDNQQLPITSELEAACGSNLGHLYLRQVPSATDAINAKHSMTPKITGLIVSTANGVVAFTTRMQTDSLLLDVENDSNISRSVSTQSKMILSAMWNSLFLKLKSYSDPGFLVVEMEFFPQDGSIRSVRPCSVVPASSSSPLACSTTSVAKTTILGESILKLANELNKFGSRLDMCDEQPISSFCEGWNTVYMSTTCMALMREEPCVLTPNNNQVTTGALHQQQQLGQNVNSRGAMNSTTTSDILAVDQGQKQNVNVAGNVINNNVELDFELNEESDELGMEDEEEGGDLKTKRNKNMEWAFKMCTPIAKEEQQAISMPTNVDDAF